MTQMGEQADYLRFMPVQTNMNKCRWWFSVLTGGPGWVVLGVLKMLGGALLAYLAITHAVPVERGLPICCPTYKLPLTEMDAWARRDLLQAG